MDLYDLPTVGTESHGLQVVAVNGRTQVGVPYWGSSKMAKLEFLTADERAALKAAAASGGVGCRWKRRCGTWCH